MSRHRNVRSMNVDDEFYDEDEVYGHSVDDGYCISPATAAQFTYNRDSGLDLSNYMKGERITEESESDDECGSPRTAPPVLSDVDRARLSSCKDEIHSVLGDTVSDQRLTEVILKHRFNFELALDELLSVQDAIPSSKRQPSSTTKGVRDAPASGIPGTRSKSSKTPSIVTSDSKWNGLTKDFSTGDVASKLSTMTIVAGKTPIKGFRPDNTDEANSKGDAVDVQTLADKEFSLAQELVGEMPLPNQVKVDADKTQSAAPKLTPSKSRLSLEKMKEEYARRLEGKDLINLVVIGHVDAGKSTLLGHLLFQIGNVNKRAMHKYEQEAQKVGKSSFMYAWVLDETDEERTRGVTMDIAQTNFETDHKVVTLLDAPGHKDFIPYMITGAAQADTAILVINATRGEFETGFEAGGQTREHSLLARSLGVAQIIIAVNKMDTVEWSQSRYNDIASTIGQFLRQIGYKDADLSYVPCSGLNGVNLYRTPQEPNLVSWYTGPTLIQQIDKLRRVERQIEKTVRVSVSDVFKGLTSGFVVAGKVVSGVVQTGDRLLIMPAGEVANVKAITVDEASALCSFAGDNASLSLTGIDPNQVTIGSILCDPANAIVATTRFRARVVIFNTSVPITKGFPVVLHYQSMSEPAFIKSLVSQLSKSTGQVIKNRPKCLLKNSNAMIEIGLERPICIETYRDFRDLGRFMLRSNGATIAAGLVEQVTLSKGS